MKFRNSTVLQLILPQAGVWFFFLFSSLIFVFALFPPTLQARKSSEPGVIDMSNRQSAIDVPARRIVIFPPVAWDYITVDAGVEHLMAISHYMHKEIDDGLLDKIYPESANIPDAFTNGINSAIPGDPESLILANPDAIVSWAHFSGPLKQIGLPVAETRAIEGEAGVLSLYRLLGALSGQQKRVDSLMDRYQEKSKEVKAKIDGLNIREKPTAMFIWIIGENSLYAANWESSQSRALKAAGAINLVGDFKNGLLDMEQLLLLNPDVIFLHNNFGVIKEPDFFYKQPQFQSLAAVRNKRVYKQPAGSARMESLVDEPLLQLWMAEILYPGQMPKTFRGEFKEAYRKAYQYEISDNELDSNVFLKDNLSSAGYERFMR